MTQINPSIQSRIETLAAVFAREVVAALRTVQLSELAALAEKVSVMAGHAPTKPKRVVKNYPHCSWAGCGKNRSPMTLPYCGEHWRAAKSGQQPPDSPADAAEGSTAAPVVPRASTGGRNRRRVGADAASGA